MKRGLALVVASVLLLLCGSAFADDIYKDPILFRGAKWGDNYSSAQAVLPDGVKMRDLKTAEYWYPMSDNMFDGSGFSYQYKAEMGCYTYATSSSLKGVKVAGYDVEDLYLYFLFTPDDSGKLVKDANHTALIYAYYKLEPKDPDTVYADLVTKLTSLYGDVDFEQKKAPYISYEQSMWYGADDTMVSIVREDYPTGSHYIYIKYGFKGGDALMEQAYAAVVKEENENAGSNTDGL